MKLSWQQKELFYHEIAQYTRSGITLREALESMLDEMPPGATRQFVRRLHRRTKDGQDLGEILMSETGQFTEVEQALIDAGATSGRLEQCFRYLSEYFKSLCEARRGITRGLLYPAFLLHFAVFVLNLPKLIPSGDVEGYLRSVFIVLLIVYIIGISLYIVMSLWAMAARKAPPLDALFRFIPLLGGIHKFSGLSRFCVALEMQMQAGIPMLQALPVAGRSSQSGLIHAAAKRAIPKVNQGQDLAQALRAPGTFPQALIRALRMGQDAGSIDEELRKWGDFYLQRMLVRLNLLAEWLPRMIYLAVVLYVAYMIITTYQKYISGLMEMTDF